MITNLSTLKFLCIPSFLCCHQKFWLLIFHLSTFFLVLQAQEKQIVEVRGRGLKSAVYGRKWYMDFISGFRYGDHQYAVALKRHCAFGDCYPRETHGTRVSRLTVYKLSETLDVLEKWSMRISVPESANEFQIIRCIPLADRLLLFFRVLENGEQFASIYCTSYSLLDWTSQTNRLAQFSIDKDYSSQNLYSTIYQYEIMPIQEKGEFLITSTRSIPYIEADPGNARHSTRMALYNARLDLLIEKEHYQVVPLRINHFLKIFNDQLGNTYILSAKLGSMLQNASLPVKILIFPLNSDTFTSLLVNVPSAQTLLIDNEIRDSFNLSLYAFNCKRTDSTTRMEKVKLDIRTGAIVTAGNWNITNPKDSILTKSTVRFSLNQSIIGSNSINNFWQSPYEGQLSSERQVKEGTTFDRCPLLINDQFGNPSFYFESNWYKRSATPTTKYGGRDAFGRQTTYTGTDFTQLYRFGPGFLFTTVSKEEGHLSIIEFPHSKRVNLFVANFFSLDNLNAYACPVMLDSAHFLIYSPMFAGIINKGASTLKLMEIKMARNEQHAQMVRIDDRYLLVYKKRKRKLYFGALQVK